MEDDNRRNKRTNGSNCDCNCADLRCPQYDTPTPDGAGGALSDDSDGPNAFDTGEPLPHDVNGFWDAVCNWICSDGTSFSCCVGGGHSGVGDFGGGSVDCGGISC